MVYWNLRLRRAKSGDRNLLMFHLPETDVHSPSTLAPTAAYFRRISDSPIIIISLTTERATAILHSCCSLTS
jgi:hypothetical protein